MVTAKVVNSLYKEYRKRPKSPDRLDLSVLAEKAGDNINVEIKDDRLIIHNVDEKSPFHALKLNRVHGIVNFEKTIAIVLAQSMILLLKETGEVQINIKPVKRSFWAKLRDKFCR